MADKKKKNIFARIGAGFKGVIGELKKVIWPSKDKLKSICAVVFVVIIFFAIYLYAVSEGGHWILDKVGFYDQVDPTEATSESVDLQFDETAPSDASETAADTTDATDASNETEATTAASETTEATTKATEATEST